MKNLLPSGILAIGFIIGCFVLGKAWVESRSVQFVTVKGLSEREVSADRAWWSIQGRYGGNSIGAVQSELDRHENKVMTFLEDQGFSSDEAKVDNINIFQNQYQGATDRYSAEIRISITSDDVAKIETAASKIGDLIAEGILLTGDKWSNGPKYYFTDFVEIKPVMLAEATVEAKKAADEFAKNSGSAVGKIKQANQGVFRILPANRTNESEEFFRNKLIRVVSTVQYYLN